ncbi:MULTISPECIES: phage integrase central domain-containing protein [unclassified Saccharibacter]|uniref:tyrosine-type recombinase/integrase n=1 Tax=unclassified Saccharibacter TaxID=2648722 RepID=UPI001324C86F|nr:MULTISPECIES: integrase arm-type DNA-binding domain-containing protein [unclassified Saccharibacter]MXV35540.1 tyrosine-type recombinase/integrase [Saccharibacter sp. EH611]MXV58200.1 tyrosine-type recombinase/integrase [Saccharibacter sp. EH70]MXV65473.1 tyrosine-type recombinase/integrase [Saccharibacter sp. EH60]
MLTNLAIKNAQSREKAYKMADAQGLYILVKPNGSKLWYLKYRFGGKERKLSFGPYPEVSLTAARQAKETARAELREGQDPSLTKKQKRAAASKEESTFGSVTQKWFEHNAARWTAKHQHDVISSLERLVLPSLAKIPLDSITAPMVLEVLKRIERNRAIETAHRVRQRISAVFCYGIACGLANNDPASQLKSILKPVPKGRQPAITDLPTLCKMLETIEENPAQPVTLLAFRFLALTAVRSSELREMRWDEVNGDVWSIPSERMKMKRPHIVPLARQAIEILEVVKSITGNGPLVFPSVRWSHKPMSDMTLSALIKRAGYTGQHVPHGFRASFSSIMNEKRPEDRAIIDLMLAHVSKNKVESAYNRAQHLEKRREIAQEWADLLLQNCLRAYDLLFTERRPSPAPSPK